MTVSINEAAKALGISSTSVRRLMKRGFLRPLRHLRHLMIPVAQLLALTQECSPATDILTRPPRRKVSGATPKPERVGERPYLAGFSPEEVEAINKQTNDADAPPALDSKKLEHETAMEGGAE